MKVTFATAFLLLAPALIRAWKFEVFENADCENSVDLITSDDDDDEGDLDRICEDTPEPHGCFRISDFEGCEIYLHADVAGCESQTVTMMFDEESEDEDIVPNFAWENWSIICDD